FAQCAPTKGDDAPARVANREHDAIAKAIPSSAILALDQQPGANRRTLVRQALQAVPVVGRVTEGNLLRGGAGNASAFQIVDWLRRAAQRLPIKSAGLLHGLIQWRQARAVLAALLVALGHFQARLLCQQPDRIAELHAIVF